MKKIILSLTLLIFLTSCPVMAAVEPISTVEPHMTTTLSIDTVKNEVEDSQLLIRDWKAQIKSIKKEGFSIMALFGIIVLILLSLIVLGVIIVMFLNLIEFFTPPATDEKLDKIEAMITENFIKLPVKILAILRGVVRKK